MDDWLYCDGMPPDAYDADEGARELLAHAPGAQLAAKMLDRESIGLFALDTGDFDLDALFTPRRDFVFRWRAVEWRPDG